MLSMPPWNYLQIPLSKRGSGLKLAVPKPSRRCRVVAEREQVHRTSVLGSCLSHPALSFQSLSGRQLKKGMFAHCFSTHLCTAYIIQNKQLSKRKQSYLHFPGENLPLWESWCQGKEKTTNWSRNGIVIPPQDKIQRFQLARPTLCAWHLSSLSSTFHKWAGQTFSKYRPMLQTAILKNCEKNFKMKKQTVIWMLF